MAAIFVRPRRSFPDPSRPEAEWPLDPNGLAAVVALAERLPTLPVVGSDMRRAIETAEFFGVPTIDRRLAEVTRPYLDDPQEAFVPYLSGQPVDGWELQVDTVARISRGRWKSTVRRPL